MPDRPARLIQANACANQHRRRCSNQWRYGGVTRNDIEQANRRDKMNSKALLLAIPVLVAVPVAAFQLGQRPPTDGAERRAPGSGASTERVLKTVTQQSIAQAIAEGTTYLRSHPGANFTIRLPAGRFDLARGSRATEASIDLSRINACPGRLTIDGAGMDKTTLVRQDDVIGMTGRNTHCVTISDLGFTQNRFETSQGTVVAADTRQVTLDIPTGFPTPGELMPAKSEIGRNGKEVVRRFLRKYRMTPSGPQILENEPQAIWAKAQRAGGAANRWTLTLVAKANNPVFRRGDLVGIKSKLGSQAYRFIGGDRITLERVRWARDSRGVFRRVNNVTVQECVIDRPAPINGVRFLLSTSDGGPQVGQPTDPMTSGHLVQNNTFVATGDDGILLARATGTVRNNRVTDSFARGIILVGSPNAKLQGNILTRAPLENLARLAPGPYGSREPAANDN